MRLGIDILENELVPRYPDVLEIVSGEAPYIASRYDNTTGALILIQNRIGILDHTLSAINENVDTTGDSLKAIKTSYNNSYAYEWQMDGPKGIIPNSCGDKSDTTVNLFGETETKHTFCVDCEKGKIRKHNGNYALIKNWSNKDSKTR